MRTLIYSLAISLTMIVTAGTSYADGTTPGPEQWHDGDLIDCWSVKANDGDTAPANMTSFDLWWVTGPIGQYLFAIGDAFREAKLGPYCGPLEAENCIELWEYTGIGANYPESVVKLVSETQSEAIVDFGGSILGVPFSARLRILKGEEKNYHSPITVTSPVKWQGYCTVTANFYAK